MAAAVVGESPVDGRVTDLPNDTGPAAPASWPGCGAVRAGSRAPCPKTARAGPWREGAGAPAARILHDYSGEMLTGFTARTPRLLWEATRRLPGRAAVAAVVLALACLSAPSASAASAPSQAPAAVEATPSAHQAAPSPARAQRQYVYTMGILADVTPDRLTLRFEDGSTEAYRLTSMTTIQSQNADAERLENLTPGNMVIVIAEEHDNTALTVVDSGGTAFHPAGPADIRGHHDECGGGAQVDADGEIAAQADADSAVVARTPCGAGAAAR